jgi:hypothetical protein
LRHRSFDRVGIGEQRSDMPRSDDLVDATDPRDARR